MHYISSEGGVGGSIFTQGGVRKGLLLRGEGWEVVVIVNSSGEEKKEIAHRRVYGAFFKSQVFSFSQ